LFIEILAGDVCFVNFFRSILPVVPTKCDVLIVRRQHNDKEWKFKEQRAKMWENIAGVKRYSRPGGFNIAGASAAAVPTPLVGGILNVIHEGAGAVMQPVATSSVAACVV